MEDSTFSQKLAAEVIGTFVLVFFGCGSVVYAGAINAVGDLTTITTIGLTFGLAVLVMIYAFGRISGGHFNPAVSVGAGMGGRMPWRHVGLYVAAQLAGAVLGALVLFLLMQGFADFDAEGNMGQNYFGDQGSHYAWWAAFLLEMLTTAIFVMVILAVTDERNEHPSLAPLTIGLTLAAIHFVSIPATGTSVNPARSIGPALFAGGDAIVQLWLFILAPTIGAAVAGFGYPLLFGRTSDPVPGSGISFSRPRTAAQVPGYAAPDQYQLQWNQESAAESSAQGGAQAPIIQDGWQWDPIGQQWHPVGQSPEQWRAQQAAQQPVEPVQDPITESVQQPVPDSVQHHPATEAVPEQRSWPESEPGDGGTQIRPPGH
jgi:aquaporin Z